MTKADVLLGLQWGDEGKGKVVDVKASKYQLVARFQGGPNAGHTISFEGKKFVLHTVPSGIFTEGCLNIVGNGVVLDPIGFMKELEGLRAAGFSPEKQLVISRRAHLILPTHRLLDAASEQAKGKEKIGSTLRGIGPAYMDRTGRNGLRMGDLLAADFDQRYGKLKAKHQRLLAAMDWETPDEIPDEAAFLEAVDQLRQLKTDNTEYLIQEALKQDQKVLAEGAQGTLLDLEFGSYPYVTSSNTLASGACSGLGLAPSQLGNITGIFKAYCTRVGSGPFPTELFDDAGDFIRTKGHEFGSTTGRPRRCGWLDLTALQYAVMINGVTELAMMKADVLCGMKEVKLCTAYRVDGKESRQMPFDLSTATPIYETMEGWDFDPSELLQGDLANPGKTEMPKGLQKYIERIEESCGVPVRIVSIGPGRTETLMR